MITLPLLSKGRRAEGHFEQLGKTQKGTESLLFSDNSLYHKWLFWFWKESEALSNLFPKQRKVFYNHVQMIGNRIMYITRLNKQRKLV